MRGLTAIGVILHFGSGRSVSADAARMGPTEKRIVSTDTDPVTFPGFATTTLGCEDRCADVSDGAPGAECNSTLLAGCVCVFDDPYCFSDCVDEGEGGGEWLMACAGQPPPPLPGDDPSPAPTPPGDPEEDVLNTDFSFFEGPWYSCRETSVVTNNGRPVGESPVEEVACGGELLGSVARVGGSAQALVFDMQAWEDCGEHDLGGPGQASCPNDGHVRVRRSFYGVGSFSAADAFKFSADRTELQDAVGDWQSDPARAQIEDADALACRQYLDGIVCDLRLTEYRDEYHVAMGCQKNGNCKGWGEQKCNRRGGVWTDGCGDTTVVTNGGARGKLASYYLVPDLDQCHSCAD